MILNLVDTTGTHSEYPLSLTLRVKLNPTITEYNELIGQAKLRIRRLNLREHHQQLFLLEQHDEKAGYLYLSLWVSDKPRVVVDDDRTYIDHNGSTAWMKGDENRNSRLFSLYKLRTSDEITWQGYGSAIGNQPARTWLLKYINLNW